MANSEGDRLWTSRQFDEAALSYLQAQKAAHELADPSLEARAWLSVCSAQKANNHYVAALQSCQNSYRIGLRAHNNTWAGGAAGNLANLYRLLGEYSLAEKQGLQALALLQDSPRQDFLINALVSLMDLCLEEGRTSEGIAYGDRAIRLAQRASLTASEALLWDVRGFALMKANQLGEAEEAFRRAAAVEAGNKDKPLNHLILGHRSELEFRKGNYAQALLLNDQALAGRPGTLSDVPGYYFVHVRGLILAALDRKTEALLQLRKAVELANRWRESIIPGDNTNTQTVVYLSEVYGDFAHLAADLALRRNDQALARQALAALAQNRGASLREQLAASLVRNAKFSDQQFQLLSELQTVQARVTLGDRSPQDVAKLQALRLQLSELEDQSLSSFSYREKSSPEKSLDDIQSKLESSEVLLSFSLGEKSSFLWAVTRDGVQLFRLPKQSEIQDLSERFAEQVEHSRDDRSVTQAFSRVLFGQLGANVWAKPNWLITEDGAVAGQIPYAALLEVNGGGDVPLIAHHSLRLLPSELLLLLPETAKPQRAFVGVADPIYNLADSRRARDLHFIPASAPRPAASLGRLAGSELEVRSAAKLSGMPRVEILSGADANGSELRKALQAEPEMVHFAVHVVSPEGKPQEAALALSLTKENIPQLLTRETVAAYRVPGSLVVLSGCDSGQGKALPSAGLIGLGRAWLLAGATAVVVSSWPIPDDSGDFFSAFYRHLQTEIAGSLAQRAATALERAQLDMLHSSGYRTARSFWATYSILSKE